MARLGGKWLLSFFRVGRITRWSRGRSPWGVYLGETGYHKGVDITSALGLCVASVSTFGRKGDSSSLVEKVHEAHADESEGPDGFHPGKSARDGIGRFLWRSFRR